MQAKQRYRKKEKLYLRVLRFVGESSVNELKNGCSLEKVGYENNGSYWPIVILFKDGEEVKRWYYPI